MSGGFGERLRTVIAERGRLCVGIDPHEHLLTQWGLDASAAGSREFGLRVVDAAAGRAGIVKPQVAFFERYGSAGYAALEDVLAAARAAGLLVIADAKRGDIGSTMDAYARAWLTPGSPLEADALTVNPYLGVGSLGDTAALALAHGKGLFVLAATSNPEAAELQTGRVGAQTTAGRVVADVTELNARTSGTGEWGSIGIVVGATVDRAAFGLPATITPPAPILAPGFGHQGAALSEFAALFGSLAPAVVASESRGILAGGADEVADRIQARVDQLEEAAHG